MDLVITGTVMIMGSIANGLLIWSYEGEMEWKTGYLANLSILTAAFGA